MFEDKLVSIIMPAYNSERFIKESIDSVILQSYSFWELIVINDNSTDNTEEIVNEYCNLDSRIKLYRNDSINGAANARNVALHLSKGKYIAFLDSDDIWLERKLELQVNILDSGGFGASHSSYIRIDETGKKINEINCRGVVSYANQLKTNCIPNLTGIYNREVVGLVMQNNVGHEDYDMWLRILSQVSSKGIQEPLAKYRVCSNSLSSNKIKAALWHYRIIERQVGLSRKRKINAMLLYIYNAILKRI